MLEKAQWTEGWKKWKVMKSALVESATEILGKAKGSQPDWFRESEEVISPYIKSRSTLYSKWLGSHDKQYTWSTFELLEVDNLETQK